MIFLQTQKNHVDHRDWLLMQFMSDDDTYNSLYLCDVDLLMSIQCDDDEKVKIVWEIVNELMQKIDDAVKLYWNLKKNQQSHMHIIIAILTELQSLCSFAQCKYFLFFFTLHIFSSSSTITLLHWRQQSWKRADDESVKQWMIDELMTTKCRSQINVWKTEFMSAEQINSNRLMLWLQEVCTDCETLKNRSWRTQQDRKAEIFFRVCCRITC